MTIAYSILVYFIICYQKELKISNIVHISLMSDNLACVNTFISHQKSK